VTWYFVTQEKRTVPKIERPHPEPYMTYIRMPPGAYEGDTIDIEVEVENYGDAGWVGVAFSPISPPMLEAVDTYFEMAAGGLYTARLSYTMPGEDLTGYVGVYYWLDGVPPYGPVTGPTEAVRAPGRILGLPVRIRLGRLALAPSVSDILAMAPLAIPVVFLGGSLIGQLAK